MKETTRLTALDSIRGIAAIVVAFFWHYQHFAPKNGYPFSQKLYWAYNYGWSLVDLFFVLSGFVFAYVYTKKIANGNLTFEEFIALRFSRLYPLHFITLIFVLIVQYWRPQPYENFFVYPNNDIFHLLLNIFFIHYGWFESGFSFNGPSWSISSELVAYILFYVVVSKFRKINKIHYAYIGLIMLGLYIFKVDGKVPFFNQATSRVLIGFFVGCILYKINELINQSKRKTLIITISALLLFIVVRNASIQGHRLLGAWPQVYTMLIFPLIIIVALNIKIISDALSIKPLSYLGELSFSIYLWHFPVQLSINTLDKILMLNIDYSSKKLLLVYVIITLIISVVSYELIEKPSQKYLRKKLLKKSLSPKSIEIPAAALNTNSTSV